MKSIVRKIIFIIKNKVSYRKSKVEWRKRNGHNRTNIINLFDLNKVSVGRQTYGGLCVHDFKNPQEKLTIGNFCSIGPSVEFYLGGEHHPEFVSNYPFKIFIESETARQIDDRRTKGEIVLEDDVWIGAHAIILSGVRIGQGAIVGAGSVVAKDIPPYAVVVGGRILKKRFSEDIIAKLIKLDYGKLTDEYIKDHIDYFYNADIHWIIKCFEHDGLIKNDDK